MNYHHTYNVGQTHSLPTAHRSQCNISRHSRPQTHTVPSQIDPLQLSLLSTRGPSCVFQVELSPLSVVCQG